MNEQPQSQQSSEQPDQSPEQHQSSTNASNTPKFTKEDAQSIFVPLTSKNFLNPLAGEINPTKLTPRQVEAIVNEGHTSNIVKYGFGFLYCVWALFICGVYHQSAY